MLSLHNLRLYAAIAIGKTAGFTSRVLRLGGGTTLPGTLARHLAPNILRQLSKQLDQGVVLIAGTNGKTTTARLLANILTESGQKIIHNRAGANLLAGLTATALTESSLVGKPHASLALFETDEAALPTAIQETQPRLVILHNLFRDQLDRYGEVDTIARQWHSALAHLPETSIVLLNADDPAIANLGHGLTAQVSFYGLEDTRHASNHIVHIADSQFCHSCGAPYTYSAIFYAHIGHYTCPQCGKHRPSPNYRLERLDLAGTTASQLFFSYPGGAFESRLPLPGLYNALNALAASSGALLLGVDPKQVRTTLEHFDAAFGRIEHIDADGKPILLALIKNPVGASETVRMLIGDIDHTVSTSETPHRLHLLIAINDKYADGTDVSWLWDADFEQLHKYVSHIVISGTRAEDMAVRLKYAGIPAEHCHIEPDLPRAMDVAVQQLPQDQTLYVLPTYTAMLELRADLARRGWVRPFWED
ncbi:MAG: DUF1727 domain-containing protein [Chloroflexi bacterium AL-W]|nr:DUF1727 domain-containing protein [Chloroflexi bacterium AL-N1]NOK66160.1 DUF1727 domain-containing protein [Chloroflexi bacterium AL-N10]NOK73041.1 DUF1727 domain-containing protein [Chloroflexi bacterium AL-N5]NOK79938.1 DUF1727 domain-containing protein [Chloroflexi bacterium AL-W]NOK88206.1 DUF1727 domain-containing protein [Chloroflexi bacterium AL-N15]